jgi:maleate isomerase
MNQSAWERKLGLIVPSWNTVNEYEFQSVLAPHVSVHSTRVKIMADDEANFTRMAGEVPDAARLLAQSKVEVICYGCLAGGFVKGPGHDKELAAAIVNATGVPGVTAATCVIEAFEALNITRVSVASPYEQWLNDKLKSYFMAFEVEVLALKGLGTQEHARFTPEQNAKLAAEVDREDSQAIFISCSNFRTLEFIPMLEKALNKPVLTSNMCSLWKSLRVVGDKRRLSQAGRLFEEG